MAEIPSEINGVTVEFNSTVNKTVDQRLVDGLKFCIKKDVCGGHALDKIFISSASDSHDDPKSRHSQSKAVDISRINGKYIFVNYTTDTPIKSIVDAIQTAFEGYAHRRENFGPTIRKKSGSEYKIGGHNDHIHLSVD